MNVSPRIDALLAGHAGSMDSMAAALDSNSDRRLRIGIMGGTFDPIHFGHLICAEQAREQFALDYVVFMPTGNPAFKQGKRVSDAEDRYNMVVIATRKNPMFDVSRIEIEREGVTYTYDTLCELRDKLPQGTELFFITGADAIMSALRWKNAHEMTQLAQFVAAARPGFDSSEFFDMVESDPELSSKVSFFDVPGLAISSTDLRARVRAGKSIAYMTPMTVAHYIAGNRLYIDEPREVGGAR